MPYYVFYKEVDEFNNDIIGNIYTIEHASSLEKAVKAFKESPSYVKRRSNHPRFIEVTGGNTKRTIDLEEYV